MQNVKITLIKSLIGANPAQRAAAAAFGFRKIGNSIVMADNAVTAGQVKVIRHLVKVETV